MSDVHLRAQHRHSLSLHMEVYRKANDKEPLFKCRTRNIGFGGIMIRNRGLALRKGSHVTLMLKATCRSGIKQFQMDAVVIWKTPKAIGLEFGPTEAIRRRDFRRFLFEAKVSTHARARRRLIEDNITATVLPQRQMH